MIEFPKYASIKDNYCICYFGHSDEYLVQLRLLKPTIEKRFTGLKLCFGCKDNKTHLLTDCENVLKVSELKAKKLDFAHLIELRYNGHTHPVEDLLIESEITSIEQVNQLEENHTDLCTIVTHGNYPTKPLEQHQIAILTRMFKEKGFYVTVNEAIENAGVVVGVESVGLFEAAGRKTRTYLVPTGIGTKLYKLMFPLGEVIEI